MYICNIKKCGRCFGKIGHLRNHQKSHLKPYKCQHFNICHKSFATKYDLKIHERYHLNLKCEICKFCKMKFCDPRNLRKHIMHIHGNNNNKHLFICKKCKKQFKRKDSLQKHFQIHLNQNDRKSFKCKQCHICFTFKHNLNKHLKKFH